MKKFSVFVIVAGLVAAPGVAGADDRDTAKNITVPVVELPRAIEVPKVDFTPPKLDLDVERLRGIKDSINVPDLGDLGRRGGGGTVPMPDLKLDPGQREKLHQEFHRRFEMNTNPALTPELRTRIHDEIHNKVEKMDPKSLIPTPTDGGFTRPDLQVDRGQIRDLVGLRIEQGLGRNPNVPPEVKAEIRKRIDDYLQEPGR